MHMHSHFDAGADDVATATLTTYHLTRTSGPVPLTSYACTYVHPSIQSW